MIGRTLSAVTLHEPLAALTGNYLKVRLEQPREPNRLVEVEIGSLADDGLRELTSPSALPWPLRS